MKKILILFIICNLGIASMKVNAQYVDTKKVDAATKLYLAKPGYKTPYGETSSEEVKEQIVTLLSFHILRTSTSNAASRILLLASSASILSLSSLANLASASLSLVMGSFGCSQDVTPVRLLK